MLFDFDDLWTRRLKVIIANLLNKERQHREIANAASQIGSDYHGRFLVELLQNASDQATQASLTASTVSIVRTRELLAIANQGLPFDDGGIDSITSLALSPKRAGENLGNKGVGFKAVFEVSRSPEIYSSARAGGWLAEGAINSFCLDLAPFDVDGIEARLHGRLSQILQEQAGLAKELRDSLDVSDVMTAVMAEVRRAAPWKFPLQLTRAHLEARLRDLDLGWEPFTEFQTFIVLPLLLDKSIAAVVDRAVDELLAPVGAAILFLPSVTRIVVNDRTREIDSLVLRRVVRQAEPLARGARLEVVETEVGPSAETQPRTAVVRWWKVSRTIGDAEGGRVDVAEAERHAIRTAAARLPGEGWSKVDRVTVSVALPQPDFLIPPGTPLGSDGLFCIGLATRFRTGTPIWVDGHFHGTITRTAIDLELPYNSILFKESLELIGAFLERLKADPELIARRTVTLAFERAQGPVADWLWADGGLAWQAVVLGADGTTFIPPSAVALPTLEDMEIFAILASGLSDVSIFGFRLAEQALMERGRKILDVLPGAVAPPSYNDPRFLARPPGAMSLIEHGAKDHRASGPVFWEPFLSWVLNRFPVESVRDQFILPVGDDELARPQDHVFLEPVRVTDAGDPDEDDEVDIEAMSTDVRRALRLLDGRAIRVRTGVRRDVTELAARLAPLAGDRMVHRPRLDEVVNEVLAPRLQEIAKNWREQRLALGLLQQAITWIVTARPRTQGRIDCAGLRVPTVGTNGQWEWVAPTGVYLGHEWLDEEDNRLLEEAYGERPGSRLVPWSEFSAMVESNESEWWASGMRLIGVRQAPRILELGRRGQAPLIAYDYSCLTVLTESGCPLPGINEYWMEYLDAIRRRRVSYKSGQRYDVEDLSWVDGLEDARSRVAVVALMLRRPQDYEQRMETRLGRVENKGDWTSVPTLWVHTLKNNRWQVIPTECNVNDAPETPIMAPQEAWLLSTDQRRKESSKLLRRVPPRFECAARLLLEMGVNSWDSAPVERLVAELHRLATLISEETIRRSRPALVLATELYERLQDRCLEATRIGKLADLSSLLTRPVPLMKGTSLTAIELVSVVTVFIDDNPVRESFIRDYDLAYRVPLRESQEAFVEALRTVLGKERVVRTSEAPVETGFVPSRGRPKAQLLEFLGQSFSNVPIAVDLGLLIAYGGSRIADPAKEAFRQDWARFQRVLVQFGSFSERPDLAGSPIVAFYDQANAALQVAESLNPHLVLQSSWQVAGATYRHLWSAYARALFEDQRDRFFAEERIGQAQRAEVEAAIGDIPAARYKHLVTALFAIWRRFYRDEGVAVFEATWATHARSADRLAEWLGAPRLSQVLTEARDLDEEEGSMALLSAAGLPVHAWQAARSEMGSGSWSFTISRQQYEEARDKLAAGLMSFAAHAPGVDLSAAQTFIANLQISDPPLELLCKPVDFLMALGAVVRLADNLMAATKNQGSIDMLAARVQVISRVSPSELEAAVNELGTQREVGAYRRDPEPLRTEQAREVVENLLKVAVPLSQARGENIDPEAVRATPRVATLSAGWWANRWAVLAALQRALTTVAPVTAKAISEQRAFRDYIPWRELWAKFPELGLVPLSSTPVAPDRQVSLFGQKSTDDVFKRQLSQGSSGDIGKLLGRFVRDDLDLAGLRPINRGRISPPKPKGKHGRQGGSGRRTGETKLEREVNGMLGEVFVYEQFRRILPEFDEFAWVSESRACYGFSDTGKDDLGYDFRYRDILGKLTGRSNQLECVIEVKATSGDGSGPFPMSVPEWDRALKSHNSGDESVYVIVRVAGVRDAPRIMDIIVDPVDLRKKGDLEIEPQDLWVRVGMPNGVEQGSDEVSAFTE